MPAFVSAPNPAPAHISADRPRPPRVPRIAPPPPEDERETADRPRVLIAEDHEDSREAMRTLLEALGYEVVEAADGREAVERARAARPDLVLMDLMMPVMDGFQATRQIRADPALHGVPIIAVSALAGARQAVLEAGCDELVAKPIDVRAFLQRIPEWVKRGQGA
jgi:two-component system, cell cycle response regulator DivK